MSQVLSFTMSVWFLLNNLHDVPLHKVMWHKRKAMENRFRTFINYLFSVLRLTLCFLICRKIHNSTFTSFSNLSFPKPNHWKFIHNVGYNKIQDKFDFWLFNRLVLEICSFICPEKNNLSGFHLITSSAYGGHLKFVLREKFPIDTFFYCLILSFRYTWEFLVSILNSKISCFKSCHLSLVLVPGITLRKFWKLNVFYELGTWILPCTFNGN